MFAVGDQDGSGMEIIGQHRAGQGEVTGAAGPGAHDL
jgi:hypothetical protein